jgi:hypothetical protein
MAAAVMGFAFAFGGVYLGAQSGTKAEPERTAEDPVVLLQRALLPDSVSIAEARERLRQLKAIVIVPPAPLASDAPRVSTGALVMLSNVTSGRSAPSMISSTKGSE